MIAKMIDNETILITCKSFEKNKDIECCAKEYEQQGFDVCIIHSSHLVNGFVKDSTWKH